MESMHALDGLPVLLPGLQPVRHMDATYHDHAVVFLFDLTAHVCGQGSVTRVDSARLQRASEGPRQSAACGGHHIVEGGRDLPFGLDPVVGRDPAVHPELHRAVQGGQPRVAVWPLEALDP